MKKLDFSNMRTNTSQKVIIRDSMYEYKEKIRELRQRLYQLMRMRDGKSV